MCLSKEVPKTNVNPFELYYMHLHSLKKDFLGFWIRTLILIEY